VRDQHGRHLSVALRERHHKRRDASHVIRGPDIDVVALEEVLHALGVPLLRRDEERRHARNGDGVDLDIFAGEQQLHAPGVPLLRRQVERRRAVLVADVYADLGLGQKHLYGRGLPVLTRDVQRSAASSVDLVHRAVAVREQQLHDLRVALPVSPLPLPLHRQVEDRATSKVVRVDRRLLLLKQDSDHLRVRFAHSREQGLE
jgi:hypothetical protein